MPSRPTSTLMIVRHLGALLVCAVSLFVVGCGGGSGATSSVSGEPIGFEQLAQSASTSAGATSGRFSFDMSMSFPGADEPFALTGEGAFDQASERASFAVDMSSFAQLLGGFVAGLGGAGAKGAPDFDDPAGWKIEVIQDGQIGYVRFPAFDGKLPAGKSWIRADEKDVGSSLDFDQFESFAKTDPRDALEALRAVTSDVETVGAETLRGVQITHYRALIDPSELAAPAPADEQETTESLVDQIVGETGLGEMPLDVWIDGDGLVRRLMMAISAKDPSTSQASDVSLAFEIWDYNEPVTIELPPASQVVDASAVR